MSDTPLLRTNIGESGSAERRGRPEGRTGEVIPLRPSRVLARPRSDRVAMICNPRSHRNSAGTTRASIFARDMLYEAPQTPVELHAALARFAQRDVDLIVVNGGDGTVRDVITAARKVYTGTLPRFAILPSGKTNAIAIDLGMPQDVALEQLIDAARSGETQWRVPIEITREDDRAAPLSGFLFGAGAFVRATSLAQHTHRFGAFDNLAVGLSLGASIMQTLFGSASNSWRRGYPMKISGDVEMRGQFYLLLCSTLDRLPLGMKPFGSLGSGLKMLAVDAPPRRMIRYVPQLLAGSDSESLEKAGYRRRAAESLSIHIDGEFILDGETYPGGDLTLRRGAPLEFVVPQ